MMHNPIISHNNPTPASKAIKTDVHNLFMYAIVIHKHNYQLKHMMPWAQTIPSVDESEAFVRQATANWILKKADNLPNLSVTWGAIK